LGSEAWNTNMLFLPIDFRIFWVQSGTKGRRMVRHGWYKTWLAHAEDAEVIDGTLRVRPKSEA